MKKLIKQLQRIFDYYITRYRLKKGTCLNASFKCSSEFYKEESIYIKKRINEILEDNEAKYNLPLFHTYDVGMMCDDFTKGLITINVKMYYEIGK